MFWELALVSLAACVCYTEGQTKYRAYDGPPVVPVITKDGFLADTKEVADAKQYFLNALAKTAAEVKDKGPRGYSGSPHLQRVYDPVPLQPQQYQPQQYQPQQYQSEQYQSQQYQPQQYQSQQYQPQQYKSQQYQPLLHRSQPQYRPRPTQPAPVYEDDGQYDDGEYQEQPEYSPLPKTSPTSSRPDPNVTPIILENGYIADTHEVNAAKAEHFAAVARAQELVARAQQRAAQSGYQTPAPQLRPQAQYPSAPADY
ncbi:cAMP-dependent protein kinase catalytic subunit-like [Macrosteles quadrilineatus]|uniref:cAMP-dependent protein kinase catalytic subunit-like n=1 Tax=Macrosteles quadrilineatus TaxID=74068 RepID=UPI0023E224E4|nr:cAMP-dependent protein kinase catalytic subunit-like [Macrosteles quadrilineatus]